MLKVIQPRWWGKTTELIKYAQEIWKKSITRPVIIVCPDWTFANSAIRLAHKINADVTIVSIRELYRFKWVDADVLVDNMDVIMWQLLWKEIWFRDIAWWSISDDFLK